jgi:hypothetical protein
MLVAWIQPRRPGTKSIKQQPIRPADTGGEELLPGNFVVLQACRSEKRVKHFELAQERFPRDVRLDESGPLEHSPRVPDKRRLREDELRPLHAAVVVQKGKAWVSGGTAHESVPAGAKTMISIRRSGGGGETGPPGALFVPIPSAVTARRLK